MPANLVTADDLRDDPRFPRMAHVPVKRLVLDQAWLDHRLQPGTEAATLLCWCCNTLVTGRSPLCATHQAEYEDIKAERKNLRKAKRVSIPRDDAIRIHKAIANLDPLLGRLTVAYNTGADLADHVDEIMRE